MAPLIDTVVMEALRTWIILVAQCAVGVASDAFRFAVDVFACRRIGAIAFRGASDGQVVGIYAIRVGFDAI